MTREELIKLVTEIMDSSSKTEEEISRLLEILKRNVPHPAPSNLIYWSKEELSAEAIVDKALSYQPIQL